MTEGMTPADFAAMSNSGFGGEGAWWIIILFLFFMNGGWGNNKGAQDNYILASDFAQVERKIDGVNNGLCDGFYAMNTGMLNGFAGVNNAITQDTIASMQNTNAIQTQLSNCCCENRTAIQGVNYNISTNTRDIVDNANANTRAILDALNAQTIAQKDAKIAEQTQQINALQLAASQAAQNSYLVERLQPAPVPAFNVPAPYAYTGCCNCN